MARVRQAKTSETAAVKKVPPVVRSKRIDTQEIPVADEGKVRFTAEGELVDEKPEILVENNLDNINEKAARLAFLEEKVTVILAEDNGKNPEKYVFCSANGVGPGPNGVKYIPRGVPVTIARKFLEVLVKARPVTYKNNEYVDLATGERKVEQIARSSQLYPFQVVHDPNPKGVQWLTNLFARRAG